MIDIIYRITGSISPAERLAICSRTCDELIAERDWMQMQIDAYQKRVIELENDLIEANERLERTERRCHDVDAARLKAVSENKQLRAMLKRLANKGETK